VGIEQVHRCTEEYRTVGCSVRRHSARRALRQCAGWHREEENSVEFWNLRKSPFRDLHRVVEHPERLSKRLLEQRIVRRAFPNSPSEGERRRIYFLKGSEYLEKLRRDSTLVREDSAGVQTSKSFEDSREEAQEE
jgi:hypothetical protein